MSALSGRPIQKTNNQQTDVNFKLALHECAHSEPARQSLIVHCPQSGTSGSLWNQSGARAQPVISTVERTSGLKYASERTNSLHPITNNQVANCPFSIIHPEWSSLSSLLSEKNVHYTLNDGFVLRAWVCGLSENYVIVIVKFHYIKPIYAHPKQLKCAAHAEAPLDSVFVKPLWIYPALIRLIHPVGTLLDKSRTFTTMHQFLPKQGCMVVQRGSEGGSLLFYLNCLNGRRATDVSR